MTAKPIVSFDFFFGRILDGQIKFHIIIKINQIMLLKERKNMHVKNASSSLGTGRSKKTSQEKETSR